MKTEEKGSTKEKVDSMQKKYDVREKVLLAMADQSIQLVCRTMSTKMRLWSYGLSQHNEHLCTVILGCRFVPQFWW